MLIGMVCLNFRINKKVLLDVNFLLVKLVCAKLCRRRLRDLNADHSALTAHLRDLTASFEVDGYTLGTRYRLLLLHIEIGGRGSSASGAYCSHLGDFQVLLICCEGHLLLHRLAQTKIVVQDVKSCDFVCVWLLAVCHCRFGATEGWSLES